MVDVPGVVPLTEGDRTGWFWESGNKSWPRWVYKPSGRHYGYVEEKKAHNPPCWAYSYASNKGDLFYTIKEAMAYVEAEAVQEELRHER